MELQKLLQGHFKTDTYLKTLTEVKVQQSVSKDDSKLQTDFQSYKEINDFQFIWKREGDIEKLAIVNKSYET